MGLILTVVRKIPVLQYQFFLRRLLAGKSYTTASRNRYIIREKLSVFIFNATDISRKQSDGTAALFINGWLTTGSWRKLSQIDFFLGESLLITLKGTMKRGAVHPGWQNPHPT